MQKPIRRKEIKDTLMTNENSTLISFESREKADKCALEDMLKEGARRMLQAALELEVAEYAARTRKFMDDKGLRLVVRNGHLPKRELQTSF